MNSVDPLNSLFVANIYLHLATDCPVSSEEFQLIIDSKTKDPLKLFYGLVEEFYFPRGWYVSYDPLFAIRDESVEIIVMDKKDGCVLRTINATKLAENHIIVTINYVPNPYEVEGFPFYLGEVISTDRGAIHITNFLDAAVGAKFYPNEALEKQGFDHEIECIFFLEGDNWITEGGSTIHIELVHYKIFTIVFQIEADGYKTFSIDIVPMEHHTEE